MSNWQDFDFERNGTDCRLCGGAGIYESIFTDKLIQPKDKSQRPEKKRILTSIRRYDQARLDFTGDYRRVTRCHLCNEAMYRGVPEGIPQWEDEQVGELLSREEWIDNPKF